MELANIVINKVVFPRFPTRLPKKPYPDEYIQKRLFLVEADVNNEKGEYIVTPDKPYLVDLFIGMARKIKKHGVFIPKKHGFDKIVKKLKKVRKQLDDFKSTYSKREHIIKYNAFYTRWHSQLGNHDCDHRSKKYSTSITIQAISGVEIKKENANLYVSFCQKLFSHDGSDFETAGYRFGSNKTKIEFKSVAEIEEKLRKKTSVSLQKDGVISKLASWEIMNVLKKGDKGKLDLLKPGGPSLEDFTGSNAYVYETPEVRQIISLLRKKKERIIMVEGNPASGKSTALKYIGIKWADRNNAHYVKLFSDERWRWLFPKLDNLTKLKNEDLLILDDAHCNPGYVEATLRNPDINCRIIIGTRKLERLATGEETPFLLSIQRKIKLEPQISTIEKMSNLILQKRFPKENVTIDALKTNFSFSDLEYTIKNILAFTLGSKEAFLFKSGSFRKSELLLRNLWILIYILNFINKGNKDWTLNKQDFISNVKNHIIKKWKIQYGINDPFRIICALAIFSSREIPIKQSYFKDVFLVPSSDIEKLVTNDEILENNNYLSLHHSAIADLYFFCFIQDASKQSSSTEEKSFLKSHFGIEFLESLAYSRFRYLRDAFYAHYVDLYPEELYNMISVCSSNDDFLCHCLTNHWKKIEEKWNHEKCSLRWLYAVSGFFSACLLRPFKDNTEQQAYQNLVTYFSRSHTIDLLSERLKDKDDYKIVLLYFLMILQACKKIPFDRIVRIFCDELISADSDRLRDETFDFVDFSSNLFTTLRVYHPNQIALRKYLLNKIKQNVLRKFKSFDCKGKFAGYVFGKLSRLLYEIIHTDEKLPDNIINSDKIKHVIEKIFLEKTVHDTQIEIVSMICALSVFCIARPDIFREISAQLPYRTKKRFYTICNERVEREIKNLTKDGRDYKKFAWEIDHCLGPASAPYDLVSARKMIRLFKN